MRKYIIIPDYKPLYAMRKCWGPTHGPLSKPTLTPIDIIGELLMQRPPEELTIYEVEKQGDTFSEPALLTPGNYRLPYGELVGKAIETPDAKLEDIPPAVPADPVEPTIVPAASDENEQPDDVVRATISNIGPKVDTEPVGGGGDGAMSAEDLKAAKTVAAEIFNATKKYTFSFDGTENVGSPVQEDSSDSEGEGEPPTTGLPTEQLTGDPLQPEVKADPYAGMSNKQRKRAMREDAAKQTMEDAAKVAPADSSDTDDN